MRLARSLGLVPLWAAGTIASSTLNVHQETLHLKTFKPADQGQAPLVRWPVGSFTASGIELPHELASVIFSRAPGTLCKQAMKAGFFRFTITNPGSFLSVVAHPDIFLSPQLESYARFFLFLLGYSSELSDEEHRVILAYIDGRRHCPEQLRWMVDVATRARERIEAKDAKGLRELVSRFKLEEVVPALVAKVKSIPVTEGLRPRTSPPHHIQMLAHSAILGLNSFAGLSSEEKNFFAGCLKINFPGLVKGLLTERDRVPRDTTQVTDWLLRSSKVSRRWVLEYHLTAQETFALSRTKQTRKLLDDLIAEQWSQSTREPQHVKATIRRQIAAVYVALATKRRRLADSVARTMEIPAADHQSFAGCSRGKILRSVRSIIDRGVGVFTEDVQRRTTPNQVMISYWSLYMARTRDLKEIISSVLLKYTLKAADATDPLVNFLFEGVPSFYKRKWVDRIAPRSFADPTFKPNIIALLTKDPLVKVSRRVRIPLKEQRHVQIFCRDYSGRTSTVQLKSSDSIAVLRRLVSLKLEVPAARIRLVYGGRQLEDGGTLKSCGLESYSTIQVALRLLGD